jgi:predicted deacylase
MPVALTGHSFSSAVDGPRVLLTAGVHGDEYEPILAAMKLMQLLPGRLKSGSVTIVPVVNPTAYASNSRYGSDGMDLARTCPGRSGGSPTESFAYQVSELIKTADYFVDMHTGGTVYDIFPLAGYLLHPSIDILDIQRDMASAFGLPLVWGSEASAQGRTLSVARDANVPAIYVEYGGGNSARKEIVQAYEQGCLGILRYLNMIDPADELPADAAYWLEDHTPHNGVLQTKMPAPATGIFIPEVAPGDFVQKGTVWGHIVDPEDYSNTVIKAEDDGLVFLLRSKACVQQGDSLGGVLPVVKHKQVIINGK